MTTTQTASKTCPCGSAAEYAQCCQPLIKGKKKPKTAEELLRARYTAFATGEIDFVIDTHHSKTRAEIKREEIEDWSKTSDWQSLQIVQIEAGKEADTNAAIVFCARYNDGEGKAQEHWEQALFEKENGDWRFVDARGIRQGTYVRDEPKIGRNDPCHCGSGKKFKKCHGI